MDCPEVPTSSFREIDFCGVYRIAKNGRVPWLPRSSERPNGLAFSPDEKVLYVANSHEPRNLMLSHRSIGGGMGGDSQIFFDAEVEGDPV